MAQKPSVSNSDSQKEIDKLQKQFEAHEEHVNSLTLDRLNTAPKEDIEPQTKLSQTQVEKSADIYLKPKRALGVGVNPKTGEREKFNERFRSDWEFSKEYVHFTAENREIIGETIEMWTKPFPGVPCEFWQIPVNKPIWAPRYVAEQLKRKFYHRLKTENLSTGSDEKGNSYLGHLVIDTTVQRLDAIPYSGRKSIFMGKSAANF